MAYGGNIVTNPISVVAAAASGLTVTLAPTGSVVTGTNFNVTVTAYDAYQNVATDYTGTIKLTSTDGAAVLGGNYAFTSGSGQDNGIHTFSVMLNTGGTQYITATDVNAVNPLLLGLSPAITVRGLLVNSFAPTPTGFVVTFNKSIVPNDLTLYGATSSAISDIVMTGAGVGKIHGTIMVDPTNTIVTFKATADYLQLLNSLHGDNKSIVLPDATYTVTLVSGTGSNGFLDALGSGINSANNGGHSNFVTTFTTHFQANATTVLGIPDFARGPDSNTPIKVPNESAAGIPITLYNAAGVTDVTFSLTYNPALLNVTGTLSGLNSDATDAAASLTLVSNTGGVATFHYTDSKPQSATSTMPLVLGDITAIVPSGAGAAALSQYQAKELLQLGSIVINQGAVTGAVSADGVHVNAYFGDVNGDKVITGLDTLSEDSVAEGHATGFSAYSQLDPVIIGDVAGDKSIDAGDVSAIDSFVAQLNPVQIPMPPTQLQTNNPNYVNPNSIYSPNAADPTLSLVAGSSFVSVIIDHPDPDGSTGLTSATLALTYDPAIMTVTPADITLGSIPGQGTDWQLSSVVDQATGQIGIQLYSLTPITATQAGSLVNIAFHILPGATVPSTPVQLVNMATPIGQWFGTGVADSQGGMILSPGVDQLALPTGSFFGSSVTWTTPGNTETTSQANRLGLIDALVLNESHDATGTTNSAR